MECQRRQRLQALSQADLDALYALYRQRAAAQAAALAAVAPPPQPLSCSAVALVPPRPRNVHISRDVRGRDVHRVTAVAPFSTQQI